MEKPDTISVVVSHREEIPASRADLYLSVKASFLMTGNAALKKVKELAQVITQLNQNGVKDDDITLRGVLAERSSPAIGPGNPAIYLVRVHCPNLEYLPQVLAVVTAQRSVVLEQMVWLFPDDTAVQAKWLAACLAQAREKARHIADQLGVKLLGVHSFTEKWTEPTDDQKRVQFSTATGAPVVKMSTDRNSPITFLLLTTKQAEIGVEVNFRVSAYE
jgi:uncharacterized protein YggE